MKLNQYNTPVLQPRPSLKHVCLQLTQPQIPPPPHPPRPNLHAKCSKLKSPGADCTRVPRLCSSPHTMHARARNVLVSRFCPGERRRTSWSLACVANASRGRFSCEGAAAVLVNVHRTCVGVLLCVKATTVCLARACRVITETASLASGRETLLGAAQSPANCAAFEFLSTGASKG